MNDHQWQTEGDPFSLLAELYPLTTLGSDAPQTRACRLYLVACARRQWARLPGVCRGLVEVAENRPQMLARIDRMVPGDMPNPTAGQNIRRLHGEYAKFLASLARALVNDLMRKTNA